MAGDPENSLNVNTPGLDAQVEAGINVPPVGGGENDQRFKSFDMRAAATPIGEGGEGQGQETFPEIVQPNEESFWQSDADRDFTPTNDEAFGVVLLKACIKDEDSGEDEFTTQIGRIYWRKDGEINLDDDGGSGSGCDPCKTDQIGKDCYAAKEVPEGNVDHTHPE